MIRSTVAPWAESEVETPQPMTAAELMAMPDDARGYELVEGRLVRMAPSGSGHSADSLRLGAVLERFVSGHKLGRVIGAEAGFQLNQPGDPDTVLAPDAAFVRAERVPRRDTPEWPGYWRLAPDLVVDVASPSQYRPEMAEKARVWLRAGTRLVWIVWPSRRQVDVWRPEADVPIETLGVNDALDGLDVLPGFTYALSELFA